MEFINLTPENLAEEHLCCIIRSKKPHPGVEAKRTWLAERLNEGHVFRKLHEKAVVFIEYAPLETAWVPILGDNYLYLYCLWVSGSHKGKGYGRMLMEYCLQDARERGKSGVCMLGADKQKAKELPCVFNNWAVFYQGKLQTVNLLDAAALKRMFQREEGRPV